MPTSLPLTTKISQDSSRKRTYRSLSAKFGNGYGQDAPDGINDVVDTWNVTYELLSQSDRDTLVSVLDTVKSWDYLTWTAPGDASEKKWKVTKDGWSEHTTGLYYTISFTLEQSY
jgi:phage-related protein